MKMFERFKKEMPTNEELCSNAVEMLLNRLDSDYVKENFSELFDSVNKLVYAEYLKAQSKAGSVVLIERFNVGQQGIFEDMDSFFMSIFQSRKSRAGGAFEYMIRTMFRKLDYPFSEQVNIEGATPDFVLPSKDRYLAQPLDCIIFTAKRTLKERWRQVVTEANKGYAFFLATIDEEVTKSQIEQLGKHKVFLVVPKALKIGKVEYLESYNVLSFEEFFAKHLDPAVTRWK